MALSRGLVDTLADDELEAVLHHERYHVRNRDTLKMVVARAAPAAFFFLPALGYLRARYLAGRELAADRKPHATRALGVRPLAGALFQVLDQPAWSTFGAAAALGGSEFLEFRVRQLETGDEPPLTRLPRWTVAVTTVGLIALSAGFLLTVARTGGSMPMMDGTAPAGGGLAILGMVACSTAWIWVALLVTHNAMRHNP